MENVKAMASPSGPTLTDLPTELCQQIIALVLPNRSTIPAEFEKDPSSSPVLPNLDLIGYYRRQDYARRSLSIMRTNKQLYADALYLQGRCHSSRTFTLSIRPGDGTINSSGSIFFLGHDYLTPKRQYLRHSPPIFKGERRRRLAVAHKQNGQLGHANFLATKVVNLAIEIDAPINPFFSGALHIREHLTVVCKLLQTSTVLKQLSIRICQAECFRHAWFTVASWKRRTFTGFRNVNSRLEVECDVFLALQPLILLRGLSSVSIEFDGFQLLGLHKDQEAFRSQLVASLLNPERALSSQEMKLDLVTRDMQAEYPRLRQAEIEIKRRKAKDMVERLNYQIASNSHLYSPLAMAKMEKEIQDAITLEASLREREKDLRWMVDRLMDRGERREKDNELYALAALRPDVRDGMTEAEIEKARDELACAFAESREIVIDDDTDDDIDEDLEEDE
jgi:hypothetical protein